MVQNSSWPLCRSDLQLQETFGWGTCCQRRVKQLLHPRVHVLFPPCTLNVFMLCSIKTWKHIIVCGICLSRLCLCIVVTYMKIRTHFMTNLCRNSGNFKGILQLYLQSKHTFKVITINLQTFQTLLWCFTQLVLLLILIRWTLIDFFYYVVQRQEATYQYFQ